MYQKLNAQLSPDALATSIVNRFNFTVRAHDLLVLSPRPAGLQIRPYLQRFKVEVVNA